MSENTPDNPSETDGPGTPTEASGQEEQHLPPVTIDAQYIKDLSFEAPGAPSIFQALQTEAPDIQIHVDVRAAKLADNTYEVILVIRAECKAGDKVAFICELSYGGLFTLHVPDDALKAVMLIECPRLLFPFARNILADASRDGGFPPLMISPIDFVAMFREGMKNDQTENGAQQNELAEESPAGNA